jgi:hypothetical protein
MICSLLPTSCTLHIKFVKFEVLDFFIKHLIVNCSESSLCAYFFGFLGLHLSSCRSFESQVVLCLQLCMKMLFKLPPNFKFK